MENNILFMVTFTRGNRKEVFGFKSLEERKVFCEVLDIKHVKYYLSIEELSINVNDLEDVEMFWK